MKKEIDCMNAQALERKFSEIGAVVEFEDARERSRLVSVMDRFRRDPEKLKKPPKFPSPRLDVLHKEKEEVFLVETFGNPSLKVDVIDARPDQRHLLLMVKDVDRGEVSKYLCGHDERHWFVAAIPEAAHAKNVAEAMDALKPEAAYASQARHGVKPKHRNKRKNAGYARQGEWFFIPEPNLDISDSAIHKREPIVRSRMGKPHLCEELYRSGGRLLYIHPEHAPDGIDESAFKSMTRSDRKKRDGRWQRMIEGATAFVRGYVRHPDHKTVHLNGWHRVEMNLEHKAKAMEWVRFLD